VELNLGLFYFEIKMALCLFN